MYRSLGWILAVLACTLAFGQFTAVCGGEDQDEEDRLGAEAARQRDLLRDAGCMPPERKAYLRVVSRYLPEFGGNEWTVQTAIRTFDLPNSNARVALAATHHVAQPMYWKTIELALANSDLVLAEGIEAPRRDDGSGTGNKPQRANSPATVFGKTIRRYHRLLASVGGLVEEIVWEVDAWDDSWCRADVSWHEFESSLSQPRTFPDLSELRAYLDRMEGLHRRDELDDLRFQIIGGYIQAIKKELPYASPRDGAAWDGLNRARESAVLREVRERLKCVPDEGRTPRRIGVKYGACHMGNIERAIRSEHHATLLGSVWVDAISIRVKRPRSTSNGENPKPGGG